MYIVCVVCAFVCVCVVCRCWGPKMVRMRLSCRPCGLKSCR